MLWLVCFRTIRDGRCVCPDLRREGVRQNSCHHPVAVEVWISSWWNDRGHIGSERGPVPLFVVHGHIRPIGGSGCHDWGSLWLIILPEGYTCPSGEAEVNRGGQALLMTPRGLGRGGEMTPEAPVSPETSPQCSGGMEFVICAASNWHAIRAFGESTLLGPLWWGFNSRTGCRISPFVGYPGYFDTRHLECAEIT
jgi:hypothetical protein